MFTIIPLQTTNVTKTKDANMSSSRGFLFGLCICILISFFALPSAAKSKPFTSAVYLQSVIEQQAMELGTVIAIVQDSEGYIWLGGDNGVIRFDGYDTKPIKKHLDGGQKISLLGVKDILIDAESRIWVGTSEGLFLVDQEKLNATGVNTTRGGDKEIGVRRVIEGPKNKLVLLKNNTTVVYDSETTIVSSLAGIVGDDIFNKDLVVSDIAVAENNVWWIAANEGLFAFDWKTNTTEEYFLNAEEGLSFEGYEEVLTLNNGKVWVGQRSNLYELSPKTRTVSAVIRPDCAGVIEEMRQDSRGDIWVANSGSGVCLYNKQSNSLMSVGNKEVNRVRSVFEDAAGDMWFSAFPAGIYYHDRSLAYTRHFGHVPGDSQSVSHKRVVGVLEDDKGNYWFGSDSGVSVFNPQTLRYDHHTYVKDDPTTMGHSTARLRMGQKGKIWVAAWQGGLNYFDMKTRQFTRLPFDEKDRSPGVSESKFMNSSRAYHIHEGKSGNVWVATRRGGLNMYNQKDNSFIRYMPNAKDPKSISSVWVFAVLEDSKGRVWAATSNGLNLLNTETRQFERFMSNPEDNMSISDNKVLSLLEDSQGRVWAGTANGLNLFDEQQRNFKRYGKADGFKDSSVRAMVEDKTGVLWIGTSLGIAAFDPKTKNVENYRNLNGQNVTSVNYGAMHIDRNEKLMVGTIEGAWVIDTHSLGGNSNVPRIVLTDLEVFNQVIAPGDESGLLNSNINSTNRITLDYTQNMFSIGFAALDYRDPNKNQYKYRLDGFDSAWRDSTSRRALYTNLNAGKYNLIIKGSNNDGLWGEQKIIEIVQLPPPWKTWWAYSIYTLVILFSLAGFIYSQRKKRQRVEEQNRVLEVKVVARTQDLVEKNRDVQSMLSNMQQGLLTVKQGGFIHPEYSVYVETVFETSNVAGREFFDLLFQYAELSGEEKSKTIGAVNAMLGEEEYNFDFNEHVLIREYVLNLEGKVKYITLDWKPILNKDIIEKIMVTVRDETELRKSQADADRKNRQLQMIGQLMDMDTKAISQHLKKSRGFIEQNRRAIKENVNLDTEVVDMMFRNIHTLKGNSRTYGWTFLSDIAHEAETTLDIIRSNEEEWNQIKLMAELELIEECLEDYNDVNERVLSWGGGKHRHDDDVWFEKSKVSDMTGELKSLGSKLPELSRYSEYFRLMQALDQRMTVPFSDAISDVVNSLPSIAKDLGKEVPTVVIDDLGVRVKAEGEEILNDVFSHLLRNSIDHGMEGTDQRITAGKDINGKVTIACCFVDDDIEISVEDDGQGINIRSLFNKGVEIGLWGQDDTPRYSSITDLIFHSGVSTKQQVSDISGRGVGMDAVKQFLQQAGGDITVRCQDGERFIPGHATDFIHAKFVIKLPNKNFSLIHTDLTGEPSQLRA